MARNPLTDPRAALAPKTSDQDNFKEGALQTDTAVRTAANLLTFGLADKGEAAFEATLGRGGQGDWGQRYESDLAEQTRRNVYDAIHRGIARRLGQVAGVGLSVAAPGVLGAEGSAALPIKAKGLLGEALSVGKTILKGDMPAGFQVRRVLQSGAKTVVDHETAKGISVEAKFGPWARLSRNQRYAQWQWGPLYRVDRWMPYHVGNITGAVGGAGGLLSAWLQDQQVQPWRYGL